MNLRFTHLIDCREYGDTQECCCLSLNPYQSELEIEQINWAMQKGRSTPSSSVDWFSSIPSTNQRQGTQWKGLSSPWCWKRMLWSPHKHILLVRYSLRLLHTPERHFPSPHKIITKQSFRGKNRPWSNPLPSPSDDNTKAEMLKYLSELEKEFSLAGVPLPPWGQWTHSAVSTQHCLEIPTIIRDPQGETKHWEGKPPHPPTKETWRSDGR